MNFIKAFIMRFRKKKEEPQEDEPPIIITIPKRATKSEEETPAEVALVVEVEPAEVNEIVAEEPAETTLAEEEAAPAAATQVIVEDEPVAEVANEEVAEEAPLDNSQVIAVMEGGNVQESDSGAVVHTAEGKYIYLRYNKSFKAKLIQGKDEVREYYNALKNHVLSYDKVSTRISWKQESVTRGRDKICWFVLRSKSLYVYLPLNPDDYTDTKYKVERAEAKRFEELPCLYRIKNPRRVEYAKELIDTVMERYGLERNEKPEKNFVKDYPYEQTLPLIKKGLIKVTQSNKKITLDEETEEMIAEDRVRIEVRAEVQVQEVKELMTDEDAQALVILSNRKADKTKKGIVNIDVLSDCFESGETVTLDEIKKRVKGFDKKVTYVKVLARGTLNKRLTVEADEFSVDAQKMILLTGGQVIKTLS